MAVKKDQDWTKSLSNWYSKRHGDAYTIIFYSIKIFTGYSHILFHYWKYEPLENMSKWGKDIIRINFGKSCKSEITYAL